MNSAVTRLEDYDTQERFRATVVSSERITPDETDIEVRETVIGTRIALSVSTNQ